MTNGKTWDTNDLDFDKAGRLVIKNPDLSKAIEAQLDNNRQLVIRMMPFPTQNRQPVASLVPPADTADGPYRKVIEAEIVPWGGVDRWMGVRRGAPPPNPASGNLPMMSNPVPRRPPPPDPADLGCGCDINLNLDCP